MIYAEVIGDPVAQSKSPIIHKHWLERLGLVGDYRCTHVTAADLTQFFRERRDDNRWRGCNVTIPHKRAILPLLDRLDSFAEAIGAINCVIEEDGALTGYNTDIDGVAAALGSTEIRGRKAAVIGAGGGARAVIAYLASRGAARIDLIVRNPQRAEALRSLSSAVDIRFCGFNCPDTAFGGAAAIINASPLGMAGAADMPRSILDAIVAHARGATVFDLVTTPADTAFLHLAQRSGADRIVDGLTMLVGQARRAFELFFGSTPPHDDSELRSLLAQSRTD